MSKVCLAVGIADAQQLAYLPGARTGAKSFGEWARIFGYNTEVLTDEKDPVTIDIVRDSIISLLKINGNEGIDRAIIYFAGHGLRSGAADDLWLLSTWFSNQEAINVNGFLRKLDRYNIKQLVVISDACRTPPTGPQNADLTEHKLLPRGPVAERTPQADHWIASSPFRAAFMIRGPDGGQDRCIFSSILIDALWGHYPSALNQANKSKRITSISLAKCLRSEVPEIAKRYKVKGQPLELTPDLKPGLWEPDDIYVEEFSHTPPAATTWPAGGAVALGEENGAEGGPRPIGETWSTRAPYLESDAVLFGKDTVVRDETHGLPIRASAAFVSSIDEDVKISSMEASEKVRSSVEAELKSNIRSWMKALTTFFNQELPHPDFTVFKLDEDNKSNVFGQNEAQYELIGYSNKFSNFTISYTYYNRDFSGDLYKAFSPHRLNQSTPVIIALRNQMYVGAALYTNMNTDFYVTNRGVEGLIIANRRNHAADVYADEQEAHLISMMQSGKLSPNEAPKLAEQLRYRKHINPVAGVIAAYLYNRVGDIDNIRRIALYYINAGEPVPFDVALLARVASERGPGGQIIVSVPSVDLRAGYGQDDAAFTWGAMPSGRGEVAGTFPWLRQGWILLEDEGEGALYPPGLYRLSKYLLPAPFTTLNAEGGNILARWIKRGAMGSVK